MPLEREIEVFETHLDGWMKEHEGEYALIRGEDVKFFTTKEDAYEAGLELWGEVPMLIKRVQQKDEEQGSFALMCDVIHVER